MSGRRSPPRNLLRDQDESAFSEILGVLVARVPGARAAALVDREGETVDYAGSLEPYAIRLAAAHWRIVLAEVANLRAFEGVRWIALRAGRASFHVHDLPDGHALVVQLDRAAGLGGWRRAIASCAHALGSEAGWTSQGNPWFAVEVTADARRRPASLRTDAGPRPIEVLGALAGGLGRGERGWRVRFDSGVEATLVREPGGLWYSDEPVERAAPRPSRRPVRQDQQSR